ncbi:6-phosphogluconolactonase [soil metagenome]
MAEIVVVTDPDAAADIAATRIAAVLSDAVATRGRADWATTGGSTAPGIYRRLAEPPHGDDVPWPNVHVWWGDDRFVPRDHPLSNVKPFDDLLRSDVSLAAANIHPIRMTEAIAADRDPAWAADAFTRDLQAMNLELADGLPVLDLVVLGVGGDGHILSVFPGSEAFDAPTDRWGLAIPAPSHIEPHVERVTLHPGAIAAARGVLVVATGAGKAEVLARIFGPDRDPRRLPAQLTLNEHCTWILDDAAAALLPR